VSAALHTHGRYCLLYKWNAVRCSSWVAGALRENRIGNALLHFCLDMHQIDAERECAAWDDAKSDLCFWIASASKWVCRLENQAKTVTLFTGVTACSKAICILSFLLLFVLLYTCSYFCSFHIRVLSDHNSALFYSYCWLLCYKMRWGVIEEVIVLKGKMLLL
jgi:hypothetical protein